MSNQSPFESKCVKNKAKNMRPSTSLLSGIGIAGCTSADRMRKAGVGDSGKKLGKETRRQS